MDNLDKLDKEKVIHAFIVYSKLDREKALEYDSFFDLAIGEVTARIRPDVDIVENGAVLCHLCGAIAYYKYVVSVQVESASEMKLGDVTMKSDRLLAVELAGKLRDDAEMLAVELLNDDFVFMGI